MCNSKLKLLSPAKINLYLNILGKYSNGYHQIESVVQRISLFDSIGIEVVKTPSIEFTCNDEPLQNQDNLCVKAANLLKEKYSLSCGFKIKLIKNIPIGAGLGGGSSNAATVLKGIMKLLNLKIGKLELYKLGEKLGSDINFFLSDFQYAIMSGRGERIVRIKGCTLRHLVVWPRVHLSTAQVYKISRPKLTKFFSSVNILKYALEKADVKLVKRSIFNVLEKSAFELSTEVRDVKKYFDKKGYLFHVTGSGSALYTVLDKESTSKIKSILPRNWDFFEVKTF